MAEKNTTGFKVSAGAKDEKFKRYYENYVCEPLKWYLKYMTHILISINVFLRNIIVLFCRWMNI